MASYCFYEPNASTLLDRAGFTHFIEEISQHFKKQTYVLCKPLTIEDTTYGYDNAVVVFVSGMRPFFLNLGEGGTEESFQEYTEEFIDDISHLSEKYKYREKIGRRRTWEECFLRFNKSNIDIGKLGIGNAKEIRTIDLIISLVVGSINDAEKIKLETVDPLDAIKSKIILFDTDQTSFVFRSNQPSIISGKRDTLSYALVDDVG